MLKKEANIGERYGYLTVIEKLPSKNYHSMVKCLCDCGNIKDMRVTHIIQRLGSCGCNLNKLKPNTYIEKGDYIQIIVDDKTIIIDNEDKAKVSIFTWLVNDNRPRTSKHLPIGNVILEQDKNTIIDHINGNTLDNRKVNLRIATRQQNNANRIVKNTLGYRGVRINGNRYGAQIKFNGELIWLGTFDTKEEAAIAYDKKAVELFGEFAVLNFS